MWEGPTSSDEPQLQLDEMLSRLLDRAHHEVEGPDKMRALLRANQAIIGDLSLDTVLQRIVEAACQLVEAPYAALGVISPDRGGLERFIHTGVDSETAARIGPLPEGKGLLGALIDDPRPIRLRDLGADPRSVGFPAWHPPMKGFLGVPIRVRDEVYGNLYLASLNEGDFTAEDEELVLALAATAGAAIENARLYEESRHWQEWLEASTDMTRQVLLAPGDEALRMISRRVADLADADLVAVLLPGEDEQMQTSVAVGPDAHRLLGLRYPLAGTVSEVVLRTGQPQVFTNVQDPELPPDSRVIVAEVARLGPAMMLPLAGAEGVRGVLVAGRRPGRVPFDGPDVAMATNFAHQASVALELAEGRREAQRMLLLEDRARIARDLHDHVIQQLFAAGMTLQGAMMMPGENAVRVVNGVVDQLDDAIRQIRTSIFELRPPVMSGKGMRARVLQVVGDVRTTLQFAPRVQFAGPVDMVSDSGLIDDVCAVVRESLTNVARHAGAHAARVLVSAQRESLEVVVLDDGSGVGATDRRSGLANLEQRARRRTGQVEIGPPEEGSGTRVRWTVPLSPGEGTAGRMGHVQVETPGPGAGQLEEE